MRFSGSRARVIVPLGVHQILAWGSTYYLLTVLAAPISKDTGWEIGWVTAGFSVGLVSSGLVSPLVGRAIIQFGGSRVLALGSLLLAIGLCCIAIAPSLPLYLASWLVIGAGMGAALYDAAFSTLGTIFGKTARSAITTLTLFGGFASTVCWPLSALLVENWGWRAACLTYAVAHLAYSVPVLLLAIPTPVKALKVDNAVDDALSPDVPARNERVMLLLLLVFITGSAVFSITSVHLLGFLQALGISLGAAVALGMLIGPSQVGARVIEIIFGRHYHPIWTLATAGTLICTGLVLLVSGLVFPALCLILYGAGNGIWSIARGTVPLAVFGIARFPQTLASLARAAFLSQAVAPLLAAVGKAQFGEGPTMIGLAVLAVLNVGLIGLLIASLPRKAG
jgi:MFS family permease